MSVTMNWRFSVEDKKEDRNPRFQMAVVPPVPAQLGGSDYSTYSTYLCGFMVVADSKTGCVEVVKENSPRIRFD